MKLSWIKGEPVVQRPIKDLQELFEDSERARPNSTGRDVETVLTVDRILATRDKYKKQAAAKN